MAELRQVSFETSIGVGDVLRVESRLGAFPTVSASVSPQSGGQGQSVIKAQAETLIGIAAGEQRRYLASRAEPDFTASADDGQGGKLEFEGYLSTTGIKIGASGISAQVQAVHWAAEISGYRPDIYTVSEATRMETEPTGASVFGRLSEILDARVTGWGSPDEREYTNIEGIDSLMDDIHATNERLSGAVFDLLDGSADTTGYEVFEALGELAGANVALNDSLGEILSTHNGDFFTTLTGLAASFKMVYVPDKTNATAGHFAKLSDIFAEEEEKEVAFADLDISVGNASVLPVSQVVVTGLLSTDLRMSDVGEEILSNGTVPQIIARFPEEGGVEGGTVEAMGSPSFLQLPIQGQWENDGEEIDPDGMVSNRDELIAALLEFIEETAGGFGEEWAKQGYLDTALAGTALTLVVPADFSWSAGTFYKVSAISEKDGTTLMFRGLLQSEVTVLSSDQNAPQATTTLIFTHVLLGSNTLAGIDE